MLKPLQLLSALSLGVVCGTFLLPTASAGQEFRSGSVTATVGRTADVSRSQSLARPNPLVLAPSGKRVFQAKIKHRAGGVPVIDVTFNGRDTFEMIVDTGASGTVITKKMAALLGLKAESKAKFDTANARNVELVLSRVKSIEVDGAVARNVLVAVGSSELDTGLLGHDFFGNYNILIKQDTVEFLVP